MSLLEVRQLTKAFNGVAAISGVTFAAARGEVYSIIGPHGAGKTTLCNVITGLCRAQAGRILFEGEDITGLPPRRRTAKGLARTFQNPRIFHTMSAVENVMLGRHHRVPRRLLPALLRLRRAVEGDLACRAFAVELMHFVGLADYVASAASAMSYGALKRLEIARALASEPKLLLLDEPAAGCNPVETAEIGTLIRSIAAQGITVVLIEQDIRQVMDISSRILVLEHGRVLIEGSAAQISADPAVIGTYLAGAPGEGRREAADERRRWPPGRSRPCGTPA